MAKVLFVPEVIAIVKSFIPVMHELRKDPKNDVIIISLDWYKSYGAEKILEESNIEYKSIENYNTKNIVEILNIEEPDIIVVGLETSISKAFIIAAKFLNIPVLLVQHGVFSSENKRPVKTLIKIHLTNIKKFKKSTYLFFVKTLRGTTSNPIQFMVKFMRELKKDLLLVMRGNIYGYFDFTKMAVNGEYTKNLFIKQGVSPGKLVVIGQPRYDIITQRKFNKESIYKQLAVPDGKGIIVLATQWFVESKLWKEEDRKKFILDVVKAMEGFPDKQLVIKLHPMENIEEYEKILREIDSNTIICRDIAIYELLHACEILMTVRSTTALEAMILDKPVITLEFTNITHHTIYSDSKAAIGVYKKEDIAPTIEKVLYSQKVQKELKRNRAKFVYEHAHKIDGQASKRVLDLIKLMIEESKRNKGICSKSKSFLYTSK